MNVISSTPWRHLRPDDGHFHGVAARERRGGPDPAGLSDLTVEEVKQVLYDTVVDQGPPGKDNDYGYGVGTRMRRCCGRSRYASARRARQSWRRRVCLRKDTATIDVADLDLNQDPGVAETVHVTVASNTQPAGITVTLTETTPDSSRFRGTVTLSATAGPTVLQVGNGDTITATYIDADDGLCDQYVVVTATPRSIAYRRSLAMCRRWKLSRAPGEGHLHDRRAGCMTVHYGLDWCVPES